MVDCSVDVGLQRPFVSFADQKPGSLKVVLIGDAGVGKTSIISYLKDGLNVDRRRQSATLGPPVPVGDIRVTVDNKDVKLSLWDTCGQERFFSLGKSFMRGAKAVVFVYSVSSSDSFDHLFSEFRGHQSWLDSYLSISEDDKPIVCVLGNKADLSKSDTTVSFESGAARLVKEARDRQLNEFLFWETSAKSGQNLQEFSQSLASALLQKFPHNSLPSGLTLTNGNTIHLPSFAEEKKQEKKRSKFSSCLGSVLHAKAPSKKYKS